MFLEKVDDITETVKTLMIGDLDTLRNFLINTTKGMAEYLSNETNARNLVNDFKALIKTENS